MKVALTIAGSDPSGGAGLQADLKTFHQHGVYGTCVVTLLTVQNTVSVSDILPIDAGFVLAQLDAVLSDIPPQAAKTGALGDPELIRRLANRAHEFSFPLVIDPVMISKHGQPLLGERAIEALADELLPQAYLITPNRHEAERLCGITIESREAMLAAADAILRMGVANVLIKGGEFEGHSVDLLCSATETCWLESERWRTLSTHGSGCVFSAAVTARLALGDDLTEAACGAKRFISAAIRDAPGLGKGVGPVNMAVAAEFEPPDPEAKP